MSVKIIVDSSADITAQIRKQCTIVPLTVRFGDTEYVDGVTIDHETFYKKLVESDVLPTTSQSTPDAFAQEYQKVVDSGDQAVVLTLSSKLSGTYQSACIAAMDFPGSIYVVDSCNVTIAAGILTQLAVSLAQEGKAAKAIADILTRERENVCLLAILDTLEYLKKGGRISKTVAFAGELLSIKPVITIADGAVEILGKARGSRQANNLLMKEIEKAGGIDFSKPVQMGYTGLSDALMEKFAADSAALWQELEAKPECAPIGSIIGTHAGPGAVAVAFFKRS